MRDGRERTLGPKVHSGQSRQFLINSRCSHSTSVEKVSRSCPKNVTHLPHRDEHQRHGVVCSVPCDRSCVACFHPVCHDCSHETLCTRWVFNVDVENIRPNDSSSSVEPDGVTAEVNIVEEEQNTWRRVKKGTKLQLDAGRRSALLLSSQRVKPHFIAESFITSTVKNALSRTPREAFPATRIRARPRDQPQPDLTNITTPTTIPTSATPHQPSPSSSPLPPPPSFPLSRI